MSAGISPLVSGLASTLFQSGLQPDITLVATTSTSPLLFPSTLSLPTMTASVSSSNLLSLPSIQGSIPPSPALSTILLTSHHLKCQRLTQSGLYYSRLDSLDLASASTSPSSAFPWPLDVMWTSADQTNWEIGLARLTASAGLPLRWVENPEWKKFCDRFLPMAKNPSSKVLTTQIIPEVLSRLQSSAQADCQGSEATLQYDR